MGKPPPVETNEFEIVGRPAVIYTGRGERDDVISRILDEIMRTIETGDAIRVKFVGTRGKYMASLRNGMKRRGYGIEWSKWGNEHVDVWAVPLKP